MHGRPYIRPHINATCQPLCCASSCAVLLHDNHSKRAIDDVNTTCGYVHMYGFGQPYNSKTRALPSWCVLTTHLSPPADPGAAFMPSWSALTTQHSPPADPGAAFMVCPDPATLTSSRSWWCLHAFMVCPDHATLTSSRFWCCLHGLF